MQLTQCVFTMFDQAAGSYSTPFFEDTVAQAMRAVDTATRDEANNIHKYPQDFTLFLLGTFNQRIAEFKLRKLPLPIMNAKTGPCVDPNAAEFQPDLSATEQETIAAVIAGINSNESETPSS